MNFAVSEEWRPEAPGCDPASPKKIQHSRAVKRIRFIFRAVARNFLEGKRDFTYSPSVSGRRERVMSFARGLPAWPYPR